MTRKVNPSKTAIRKATQKYVELVLECGAAYEWFDHCYARACQNGKGQQSP